MLLESVRDYCSVGTRSVIQSTPPPRFRSTDPDRMVLKMASTLVYFDFALYIGRRCVLPRTRGTSTQLPRHAIVNTSDWLGARSGSLHPLPPPFCTGGLTIYARLSYSTVLKRASAYSSCRVPRVSFVSLHAHAHDHSTLVSCSCGLHELRISRSERARRLSSVRIDVLYKIPTSSSSMMRPDPPTKGDVRMLSNGIPLIA